MANDLTGNPWVLDSVMASPYFGAVFINDLSWTEEANTGDRLIILRSNGKIIIDTTASAPNVFERFGRIDHVEGFQLTRIDSGKVLVFIK